LCCLSHIGMFIREQLTQKWYGFYDLQLIKTINRRFPHDEVWIVQALKQSWNCQFRKELDQVVQYTTSHIW